MKFNENDKTTLKLKIKKKFIFSKGQPVLLSVGWPPHGAAIWSPPALGLGIVRDLGNPALGRPIMATPRLSKAGQHFVFKFLNNFDK